MMTEEGAFSIIPTYLRLAAQGENILAFAPTNIIGATSAGRRMWRRRSAI